MTRTLVSVGRLANAGVHGKSVELKRQDLWIKDIAITTGLVSATTTPMLLRLVAQGRLTPEKLASHRFTFDTIIDACASPTLSSAPTEPVADMVLPLATVSGRPATRALLGSVNARSATKGSHQATRRPR